MKYIAILWTLTSLATADQVFRRTCVDPGGPCWRDSHCCDSDKGYGCMNRRCTLRPGGVCIPAGQRCNPADQTPCCDSDHFNCSVLTRRCAAIPHDHYYQTHKKAQGLQPPTKHQQRDLASLPGVDIAARSEKEDQQGAGPKPRSEKEDSEPRPDKQDEGAGPEQLFPRYCVPYGNSCRADADCCNFHGGVGCHNLQCLWQHGIQCIPLGKSCHPLQKNTCCQPNYHYCDAKTYTCVFREYEQYHDFYQMMQPSSTRRPPIKKKQNREPRDLASLPAEADIAARSEKEDQVAGSKPRSDKEDGGAGPEQLSRRSDDCVAVGDACRLDEHCCDSDKGVGCINRRCTQRSGGCVPPGDSCNPSGTPCCNSDHFSCSAFTRKCGATSWNSYHQDQSRPKPKPGSGSGHSKTRRPTVNKKQQRKPRRDLASVLEVDTAARSEREDKDAGSEQLFRRQCSPLHEVCRRDRDCCNPQLGVGCFSGRCYWRQGPQCIPLGGNCDPRRKKILAQCCDTDHHYCNPSTSTCVVKPPGLVLSGLVHGLKWPPGREWSEGRRLST